MSRARVAAAVGRGLLPVNLLISFLIASSAVAEVRETLEYTYYDAVAKPGQSLSSTLAGASPIKEQGRIFLGQTKWDVRWNIWWNERDGACKITSVRTHVAAIIKLPRLVGGNAEQVSAFERYAVALKQHELGHYQIGKDAAMEIDHALLTMPAMPDCSRLVKTANDGAYRTLELYKEKERLYDVDTGHGKSQGAWLDK